MMNQAESSSPITLNISTAAGQITACVDGAALAQTALDSLPGVAAAQLDPPDAGRRLLDALGGQALLARLTAGGSDLLYLDIPSGDPADALPWEFAQLPDGRFLAGVYGLLRLVDGPPARPGPDGPLQFIALGADPLVDGQGRSRDHEPRLRLDHEMSRIRRTLQESGRQVSGRRILPTAAALGRALAAGQPTWLHLSCHGSVVQTTHGPLAQLLLEDDNGRAKFLDGPHLAALAQGDNVRLALLSACLTADGQASLARALVTAGLPAAIGMIGRFPDHLSDDLATALYGALLAGQPLGAALRRARLALSQMPAAVGLPVAYVRRGGDAPRAVPEGRAELRRLDLSERCRLPLEVRPPRPLLGRGQALHDLAHRFHPEQGAARVVTVTGTGGMGKTALAAAFAERFALRWPDGVIGLSFAAGLVEAARFRGELLERLTGDEGADLPTRRQEEALLAALQPWEGLLLVDNYESVQQALAGDDLAAQAEARAIHRLLRLIARGGGWLLLTSRHKPAGLPNERLFPEDGRALPGLDILAGADLFFRYSPSAAGRQKEDAILALAREVALVTDGHPLAIALLAGQFEAAPAAPDRFLAGWEAQLAAARSDALDDHHRTFAAAFDRSYESLTAAQQARLCALSRFTYPFYSVAAYLLWQPGDEPALPEDDDDLAESRRWLRELTDRSLLGIDSFYEDGTPATYRFQPAVQQEVARRAPQGPPPGRAAAYAYWLAERGYGDIHKDVGLNRVLRLSLESLPAAAGHLQGSRRLWHLRRVGWLLDAYGQTGRALALLEDALAEARQLAGDEPDREKLISGLAYQLARVYVTRGDLARALALYQESLQLKEQIGDIKGKAASLSMMANIYLTTRNLDRAETLLRQSIALGQQLGDIQGIAFDTTKLGQVARAQGDLAQARQQYEAGLAIFRHLGMPRETAQVEQLLASLAGGPAGEPDDPLLTHSQAARTAGEAGDYQAAVAAQEQAVALARQAGDDHDALVRLSILLYNLAGYYGRAGQHQAAVTALEEVVALDERTGHPDLASDRAALAAARQTAAGQPPQPAVATAAATAEEELTAAEQAQLEQAARQVAAMSPEEQALLEQVARQVAAMSPEEQAALQRRLIRDSLVAQVSQAILALRRGQLAPAQAAQVAGQVEEVAAQVAADADLGPERHDLAAFLQAAAQVLRGQPWPPVPQGYGSVVAQIDEEAG